MKTTMLNLDEVSTICMLVENELKLTKQVLDKKWVSKKCIKLLEDKRDYYEYHIKVLTQILNKLQIELKEK